MTLVEKGQRRQGRFTKVERSVLSVAEAALSPHGFEIEWGFGSKHPGVFAVKDGKTFFLPSSGTPRNPTLEKRHMARKCAEVIAGYWRPQ